MTGSATRHTPKLSTEDALEQLEVFLEKHLSGDTPVLKEISLYLIRSGGKRIRPAISFLCAELLGDITQDHIKGAACIELIHTATLFHDDVMDGSLIRRGEKTSHTIWGANHSILAGDYLLCKALSLLSEIRNWNVVRLIQTCATSVVQGQAMELAMNEVPGEKQEGSYFDVIRLKTASLFEAAAVLPGALCETSIEKMRALKVLGENLGICFQLHDDLMDYFGTEAQLGKKPGQDFREKKRTLPLIWASQRALMSEKRKIEAWLKDGSDRSFQEMATLMRTHNIPHKIFLKAGSYSKDTQQSLEKFDSPAAHEASRNLKDIVSALTEPAKL